jgi:hypothetical protein
MNEGLRVGDGDVAAIAARIGLRACMGRGRICAASFLLWIWIGRIAYSTAWLSPLHLIWWIQVGHCDGLIQVGLNLFTNVDSTLFGFGLLLWLGALE